MKIYIPDERRPAMSKNRDLLLRHGKPFSREKYLAEVESLTKDVEARFTRGNIASQSGYGRSEQDFDRESRKLAARIASGKRRL